MSDLVTRLRESIHQCRALDRSQLLAEAAAEIARLRLTDAEREAVEDAVQILRDHDAGNGEMYDTIRGLLKRFA